ncbi:hypothetical protein P43SY_009120 [Pythium insidiosum]|uniref:HIT domain-containing protein n=1 Tax=Pythium insidiosum TaxID=114742 RepID=A0AAD5LIP3_PYTIN|nr:hypothetical protein P43SY_009120 [Pythium insidiosum]
MTDTSPAVDVWATSSSNENNANASNADANASALNSAWRRDDKMAAPCVCASTHAPSSTSAASRSRLHVGVFSKHKGVRYCPEGRVLSCRFCEILRQRDEPFLYEDDTLVVFRPLHPIVPSHLLIVPRAHIRNVKMLTVDHIDVVRRMRRVAEQVLYSMALQEEQAEKQPQGAAKQSQSQAKHPLSAFDPTLDGQTTITTIEDEERQCSSGEPPAAFRNDCRFAFHLPPFNSIDHVHMHAFRGSTGYLGRIKYRTESLWCRSYDGVLARLERQGNADISASFSSSSSCEGEECRDHRRR